MQIFEDQKQRRLLGGERQQLTDGFEEGACVVERSPG